MNPLTSPPSPPQIHVPTYLLEWGAYGTGIGQFGNPVFVAASGGQVYVSDYENNAVDVFNVNGVFLKNIGSTVVGTGNGHFFGPSGVAVDNSGDIYVVDTCNGRVQVFLPNGNFLYKWGTNGGAGTTDATFTHCGQGCVGSGNTEFFMPYDLAVKDSDGATVLVYVADSANNRIQKFAFNPTAPSVNWLQYFGGSTPVTAVGQFNEPLGVSVTSNGDVVVADSANNRLQVIHANGSGARAVGVLGSLDGQFRLPTKAVQDSSGNFYVADNQNHRIQKFNTNWDYILKWGHNGGDGSMGYGAGEFIHPAGLALDAWGNLYVVDAGNDRVQKFAP